MIEVATTVLMGGVLAWVYTEERGTKDATKIQKIAKHSDLIVRDGKETHTIHLLDKRRRKWGTEYVYRIPLGLSFDDFQEKRRNFEDGLNIRNSLRDTISLEEIKKLKLDKTLRDQIKKLLNKPRGRKEVVMDYDGTLLMRVYNEPLSTKIEVTQDDLDSCKRWGIWIGDSRSDRIYHDFEKRPHMIVAGATGFGKSEFLKLLITILINNQPDNVRFHLADLKGGTELGRFRHLKQVKRFCRKVSDTQQMLEEVQKDMNKKLDILFEKGYNSVKELGQKERDFVIIDEAADINPKCRELVTDISRRGRAAGYRLIYATQYPTNETLPSQVRANIGARVVFRLETGAQSRAVLDEEGAEKLPEIEGRAIFRRVKNEIVQTPLIDKSLINKVITPHVNIRSRSDKIESKKRKKDRQNIIKFEKA